MEQIKINGWHRDNAGNIPGIHIQQGQTIYRTKVISNEETDRKIDNQNWYQNSQTNIQSLHLK